MALTSSSHQATMAVEFRKSFHVKPKTPKFSIDQPKPVIKPVVNFESFRVNGYHVHHFFKFKGWINYFDMLKNQPFPTWLKIYGETNWNHKKIIPHAKLLSGLFHKSRLIEALMNYEPTEDLAESYGDVLSSSLLGNMKLILKQEMVQLANPLRDDTPEGPKETLYRPRRKGGSLCLILRRRCRSHLRRRLSFKMRFKKWSPQLLMPTKTRSKENPQKTTFSVLA
ncbi:unnamed protein product [Vicia faba]|uniref:Uncharacterized protein n=1 Tax=Vicia faba TaxID=3906 RepID=A0AAV0ZYZ9_VICFA|nr:unnamed protein product [Vicia faba]